MMKDIAFWIISIIFYIIYFLIFKFTIGNLFSISALSNIIIIFILTVVNIPLSIFTAEKVFSIIQEK